MKKGTAIALGIGGTGALVGGYLLFGKSGLSSLTNNVSNALGGCSGTATNGLTANINPGYTPQTSVNGPSPGPSGQHEFPCLWAIAPTTLPTSGYMGGPQITRINGQVWVVIATNMAVTGTFNGQPAASQGPWNGIAEYSNGTLVRVYPQQGTASLGTWTGGY